VTLLSTGCVTPKESFGHLYAPIAIQLFSPWGLSCRWRRHFLRCQICAYPRNQWHSVLTGTISQIQLFEL